jgi:uncharacterized membrane protein YhhN
MNRKDKLQNLFLVIALTGIAGFLSGVAFDNHTLRMITKPLPVLSLLLMFKPDTKFKKLIFTGFTFSLFGDILLETSEQLFVFGLISFLIAHVFYTIGFLKRKTSNEVFAFIILFIFGFGYYCFLYDGLEKMVIPVLAYFVVILIMVWSAFAQRTFNSYSHYATWGALLFMFSDSIIAFTKFYEPFKYSRYVIILSYWIAQYFIFLSTSTDKQTTSRLKTFRK